ncbi:MAG TPA: class I SAM-dependent methyltransferase [Acidimicrobiales bacterium]|nr:class I SAM-dependent methyltransferase [Acidimicrobiales bacterium]
MSADAHVYPYSERPEVAALVPASVKRLLDVGCSRGGFGAALLRTRPGLHMVGIEADADAAHEAAAHYAEVITGTFPDHLPRDRTYDCIVFNDVLEHLVDPWAALRTAAELLEPNGTVLASIPNVRGLRNLIDLTVRGEWQYVEMGILDRTHLRFFTRRSMVRLFEESGYEIDRIHGIFPLGSRWHVAPILTRLLRDISYLEFVVVARSRHQ